MTRFQSRLLSVSIMALVPMGLLTVQRQIAREKLQRMLPPRPTWTTQVSTAGKFSIDLPSPVEEEELSKESFGIKLRMQGFAGVDTGNLFSLLYTDYPEELIEVMTPKGIFDWCEAGFVTMYPESTWTDESCEVGGFPGRNVTLQTNDGLQARAKMVLAGRRFYLITTKAGRQSYAPQLWDRFFESFEIQSSPAKPPAKPG